MLYCRWSFNGQDLTYCNCSIWNWLPFPLHPISTKSRGRSRSKCSPCSSIRTLYCFSGLGWFMAPIISWQFLGRSCSTCFRSNPASPVTLFASVTPPEIVDASNILSKNHLPLLSVVVDRDAVGDFLFPSARPEDYSLWSELIYVRGHKSISTKRYLGFYRISDNQRSSNKLKAFPRVYAFYKNFSSLPRHMALLYCARWAAINVYQRRFSRFCPDPIAESCFSQILEHSLAFGASIWSCSQPTGCRSLAGISHHEHLNDWQYSRMRRTFNRRLLIKQ